MKKPKQIKAPDIPGPTVQLCWKQAPTMGRCDRRKKHGGPCAWESVAQIAAAERRQREACQCGVAGGVSHYCSARDHCWVGKKLAATPAPFLIQSAKGCPYHVPAYPAGCPECAEIAARAALASSPASPASQS